MDFRALNKVTIKNKYPLPQINDILDQIAKIFSDIDLDLYLDYHQIQIKSNDIHTQKIDCHTPYSSYEIFFCLFSLTNVLATFMILMSHIFKLYFHCFCDILG